MCGIFGIVLNQSADLSPEFIKNSITSLFRLSESRGKEASGIVLRAGPKIVVLKKPVPATQLIKSTVFSDIFRNYVTVSTPSQNTVIKPLAVLGHSRLVTSGKSELNSNNQPVIKDGAVGIHNGVIVNDASLWQTNPAIKKEYDLDTEVLISLLKMYQRQGQTLVQSVQSTYKAIDGSASVAVLFDDNNSLLLATNTGSLYYCLSEKNEALIFASEKHILTQFISSRSAHHYFTPDAIVQLHAGEGVLVSLQSLEMNKFDLKTEQPLTTSESFPLTEKIDIVDISPPATSKKTGTDSRFHIRDDVRATMIQNVEQIFSGKVQLKRCTRCVLPETMPYISFDDQGVCNYCRNFEKRDNRLKGEQALREFVEQYPEPFR